MPGLLHCSASWAPLSSELQSIPLCWTLRSGVAMKQSKIRYGASNSFPGVEKYYIGSGRKKNLRRNFAHPTKTAACCSHAFKWQNVQAQPGGRQINGAVSLEPLDVVLVTKSENPKRCLDNYFQSLSNCIVASTEIMNDISVGTYLGKCQEPLPVAVCRNRDHVVDNCLIWA